MPILHTPKALTPVPLEVRQALLRNAQSPDADLVQHGTIFDRLNAFHEVAWCPPSSCLQETENAVNPCSSIDLVDSRTTQASLSAPPRLRVAAWNVQHGHFPTEMGNLLAQRDLDAVLLTELDIGVRRSGQHNTPALLAQAQGHGYAYGLEFLELVSLENMVGNTESDPGDGGNHENRCGFHGNGLTTRISPSAFELIHLPSEANWYSTPRRGQYRIGGRVAVAVRMPFGTGSIVLVSVHLESDTDAEGRGRQMHELLSRLDAFAKGDPILIGGDFNAGARTSGFDYRTERIFGIASEFGYSWEHFNAPGPTSRPSLITNAVQQNQARYDWFFGRGLQPSSPAIIPAMDEQTPLSDHDIIAVTVKSI